MKLRLGLIVLFLLLQGCKASEPVFRCSGSPTVAQDTPLESVLVLHNQEILASTKEGFYKASMANKKWVRLDCPDSLPQGGTLIYRGWSGEIFYYGDKGLYISKDNGWSWLLLSDEFNFRLVFPHTNGKLYAIAWSTFSRYVDGEMRREGYIVMSKDLGHTWQDITGDAKGYGLYDILPDPDHPNLVIVEGHNRRSYIFQASDEDYKWETFMELQWLENHEVTEGQFFADEYSSTGNIIWVPLQATLSNYFLYDFDSQAWIPPLDIVVDQPSYEFAQSEKKIIQAKVVFLKDTYTVNFLDLRNGLDFWSLRVVDSFGQRTPEDDQKSQHANSARTELLRYEITDQTPYTRNIDIDTLYNFTLPGIYKVQLIHCDYYVTNAAREEWLGKLASSVFTVTIKEK